MSKEVVFNVDTLRIFVQAAKIHGAEHMLLVKDEGIYLMYHSTDKSPTGVLYANNYHPDNPNCYERARAAVGGDDFAERIPVSDFDCVFQKRKPRSQLGFEVSPTQMNMFIKE